MASPAVASPVTPEIHTGGPPTPPQNGVVGDAELYPEGLIYPPPEIKVIVDKTAAFVAQQPNPAALEQKIRQREGKNAKFGFLNPEDAYHPYYRHRITVVKGGKVAPSEDAADSPSKPAQVPDDGRPKTQEPEPAHFLLQLPKINPADLDILRLTALFTARSGRDFSADLAKREASNYQFDFLKPSHTLFGYFNRLVEQYSRILNPPEEAIDSLKHYSGLSSAPLNDAEAKASGRRVILNDINNRVEWERWSRKKRQAESDEAEKERAEFDAIDWNDFQVASTVTFTDQDDLIDLPPPMTLDQVENMTLAQRKMAAMIMEGKTTDDALEDGDGDADGDGGDIPGDDAAMVESGDEEEPTSKEDSAAPSDTNKSQVNVVKGDTGAPIKIRKNYVPKSKQKPKVQTTTCRICLQQIPVDEIEEHVRIELLDPQWREKQRQAEANRAASGRLAHGVDVSSSLKELARHRGDIFGTSEDDERRKAEEEAKNKQRAREVHAWDGHLASADTTNERFQTGINLDEQIAALHKARGLTENDPNAPQIGPSIPHQPAAASLSNVPTQMPGSAAPSGDQPTPSDQFSSATISAGPQPQMGMPPTSYPPTHNAPPPAYPPSSGYVPPPQPNAVATPPVTEPDVPTEADSQAASVGAGSVRPADAEAEGQPDAKKLRPSETKVSAEQWKQMHPNPVKVAIQLPEYPSKPEWHLDGSTIDLEEVPLSYLVGTLRDRISYKLGIPVGRQRFKYNGEQLTNSTTLAVLNYVEGEPIELVVREGKK